MLQVLKFIHTLLNRLNEKVISLIIARYRMDAEMMAESPEFDLDSAADGMSEVNLHEIHFGDLMIPCPSCDEPSDSVLIGLGTSEDMDTEEEVAQLNTVGVIVYPCGETFFSTCITDKVARILNAEDNGELAPAMFVGLLDCEAHGTEYPERN